MTIFALANGYRGTRSGRPAGPSSRRRSLRSPGVPGRGLATAVPEAVTSAVPRRYLDAGRCGEGRRLRL